MAARGSITRTRLPDGLVDKIPLQLPGCRVAEDSTTMAWPGEQLTSKLKLAGVQEALVSSSVELAPGAVVSVKRVTEATKASVA